MNPPGMCSTSNQAKAEAEGGRRSPCDCHHQPYILSSSPRTDKQWASAPTSAVCVASGFTNPPVTATCSPLAAGRSRKQILYARPVGFAMSWCLTFPG